MMPVLDNHNHMLNNKHVFHGPLQQEQSILHAATFVLLVLVFVCTLALALAIGFSNPVHNDVRTNELYFPAQGMPGY